MTTGSGKKTSKAGKAPASRSRRKKVVSKAPAPAEIDKAKMAAFFSAAGPDDSTPDLVKEPAEVEEVKKTDLKESVTQALVEPTAAPVAENGPADDSEVVAKEPENDEIVVAAEPADVITTDSDKRDDSDNENAKTLMTTTSPAAGSDSNSGTFGVLPMIVVLVVLAFFWFYYVTLAPLKKAAVTKVEQGKTEISVLISRIGSLEAEVVRLKAKLVVFEKAALKPKPKKITEKVTVPAKSGVVVEKKPVVKPVVESKPAVKAVAKDSQAPAAVVKKDSSFDKAPVPFWRQMKRGPLAQQPRKKVKPAVKAPAVKVDSFSKAPKPFWLKPRVKPGAAKVKKEEKISAPSVVKVVPKAKKITAKQELVSAPALDPSFEKAPKPFWLKD